MELHVRVLPRVTFPAKVRVPVCWLTGKSSTLPFVVNEPVPPKVTVFDPDPTVIPVEMVKSPAMVRLTFVHVPAKPVKSRAPVKFAAVKVTVSDPPVMLIRGDDVETLKVRVPEIQHSWT